MTNKILLLGAALAASLQLSRPMNAIDSMWAKQAKTPRSRPIRNDEREQKHLRGYRYHYTGINLKGTPTSRKIERKATAKSVKALNKKRTTSAQKSAHLRSSKTAKG